MPQHIRMVIQPRQARHITVNVAQTQPVNNNIMKTMTQSRRSCVGTMSTIFNTRGFFVWMRWKKINVKYYLNKQIE